MNQLGYYGKTPHRGDFVRFNLPQSFIKVWDDWLQQVMISGEISTDSWPAQYAKAPAYRFILSSGIAGNTPWIGILKASQDKVGRRFPFCLALSLPEHELPCVSVSTRALWFDEAEALMTRILDINYPFDELQGELASMADRHKLAARTHASPHASSNTPSNDNVTISVLSSTALRSHQNLPSLLDTVLQQTLGEYSLWIAAGSHELTAINSGLPTDGAGQALFESNWKAVSTAHIDVNALPLALPLVDAMPPSEPTDAPIETQDAPPSENIIESTANVETQLRRPSTSEPLDVKDKVEVPSHVATQEVASENISVASDNFINTTPVVAPDIETLVLDEDDTPKAPWEQ